MVLKKLISPITNSKAYKLGIVDKDGKKIKDPRTGEDLQKIHGIETYSDVRNALQQPTLFEPYGTVVVDTLTLVEGLAEPFMFRTIKHEKGGTVKSLEGYGYGKVID